MKKIFAVVLVGSLFSFNALADYGYMYKYCQGRDFSFSASQSASVYGNDVSVENHVFIFTGIYSDDEEAQLLGVKDHWIIYKGKKHYLAIPWHKEYPIMASDFIPSPGPQWITVCP